MTNFTKYMNGHKLGLYVTLNSVMGDIEFQMARLSITKCKELIRAAGARNLTDEEVIQLRDRLYVLGDVIADAFADLHSIDQSTFEPPDDLDDWLREIGGGCNVQ